MITVALDPGIRYPAIALFEDGVLYYASRVKLPTKLQKLPMGQRCAAVSELIAIDIVQRLPAVGHSYAPVDFVFELPVIYPPKRGRRRGAPQRYKDPNDLIPLALVNGNVSGLLACASITSPTPREWLGGNTSKSDNKDPWDCPRGERALRELSADERATVVPSHDAVDAVCIGLWKVGRFGLDDGRVLPGAV